MDYIQEPKCKLFQVRPENVAIIRKQINLDTDEKREEAIDIILRWIKQQEHLIKKDFSKDYIERCIVTCKGSVEQAKLQIDKLCTMRTLIPKYFETVDIRQSDVMRIYKHGWIGIVPEMTNDLYRILIVKPSPEASTKGEDLFAFYKFFVIMAEYLKNTDFSNGYVLIVDCCDCNVARAIAGVNLIELQQVVPIFTEGFGARIKGLIFVTPSRFIEGFIKLVKPVFSQKVASRIHVSTSREGVKDYLNGTDVLPIAYGGKEKKTVELLSDNLLNALTTKEHQELLAEMKEATTDETKRQTYIFNDQYLGMPGTFRTLSVD